MGHLVCDDHVWHGRLLAVLYPWASKFLLVPCSYRFGSHRVPLFLLLSLLSLSWIFQFMKAKSFNQPLERWDTSSVTTISGMFWAADSFNQPLEGWDTSSVTEMAGVVGSVCGP
mmetsp:Transcript_32790/g.48569  ORF Transcript_32790/g.48569 Transcript_32790/m.48569 type:complete len:114 (+) Transcript_32790:295-636(+)